MLNIAPILPHRILMLCILFFCHLSFIQDLYCYACKFAYFSLLQFLILLMSSSEVFILNIILFKTRCSIFVFFIYFLFLHVHVFLYLVEQTENTFTNFFNVLFCTFYDFSHFMLQFLLIGFLPGSEHIFVFLCMLSVLYVFLVRHCEFYLLHPLKQNQILFQHEIKFLAIRLMLSRVAF